MVLPMPRLMNFATKGSNELVIYMGHQELCFHLMEQAHTRFKLTMLDSEDRTLLTTKIMDPWRHRLEDDVSVTHPRQ